LGTSLLLPPWFEARRAEIESMLEPIRVPESNRSGSVSEAAPVGAPVPTSEAEQTSQGPVPSRRTDAVFIRK